MEARIEIVDTWPGGQTATLLRETADPDLLAWQYEEGNWACDCNRALDWSRALGVEEPEGLDCCTDRFAVRVWIDGKIVYRDDE